MNQLRRFVKGLWGDGIHNNEYELVAGSNTEDKAVEPVLAIGQIMNKTKDGIPTEIRWFHLKRADVKKFIEDYDAGLRGPAI